MWVGAFGCGGGGGGTDWGDCGRKVSTQRKHACVFGGSYARGKCKRITLTLSNVLTYRCVYVGICIMHGRRKRGQGATAPPPLWRVGGSAPPPTLDIPDLSLIFYILHYFTFITIHSLFYILLYILQISPPPPPL